MTTTPTTKERKAEAQNALLVRLLNVWREGHSGLRFGQWLYNLLCHEANRTGDKIDRWDELVGGALFFKEDEDLIKLIQNEK